MTQASAEPDPVLDIPESKGGEPAYRGAVEPVDELDSLLGMVLGAAWMCLPVVGLCAVFLQAFLHALPLADWGCFLIPQACYAGMTAAGALCWTSQGWRSEWKTPIVQSLALSSAAIAITAVTLAMTEPQAAWNAFFEEGGFLPWEWRSGAVEMSYLSVGLTWGLWAAVPLCLLPAMQGAPVTSKVAWAITGVSVAAAWGWTWLSWQLAALLGAGG